MRKLVLMFTLGVSMSLLQGCAATCRDKCSATASCTEEFGGRVTDAEFDKCVSNCEEGLCGRSTTEEQQQKVIDCIVGLECGSGALSYGAKVLECSVTHCF